MRLSDHFSLNASQAELDFVDIPLHTDIPLFVDPYALSIEPDPWFAVCNDLVVSFFQLVVDSIRAADTRAAAILLLRLNEPNDTHFGLSTGAPRGRGLGREKSRLLYERLTESEAVRTGNLRDLSDCELLIPGIGPDNISDITTNLIRSQLIEYTQRQCALCGIPMQRVSSGMFWHPDRADWANTYTHLPVFLGTRILLVPKAAARYDLTVDHRDYYNQFVLDFLRSEHLDAQDGLVKTLKNGKRVVLKKQLKEIYPLSRDFLYRFSLDHPDVLNKYKESLPTSAHHISDAQIENRQQIPREIDLSSLIEQLQQIPPGNEHATEYHRFVCRTLEAILYPSLFYPAIEQEINEGRKRIDIVFTNIATEGFFHRLNANHEVRAPYVLIECKNYVQDPRNPEIDQLIGRFSDHRGRFGLLLCRTIADRQTLLSRCKDTLHANGNYIICLDDQDLEALIHFRIEHDKVGFDQYWDTLMRRLVM